MKTWGKALASGAVLLWVSACDNGPSAVAKTEPAAPQALAGLDSAAGSGRAEQVDRRNDPVPTLDGRPLWSASRDRSAQENARRAFERNGAAFGAENLDAFIKTAHAFVDKPPARAETLTRANGDVLIYDPRDNIFAVRTQEGAPRTMFKPDDGAAYWQAQKDRESRRTANTRERRADEG